MKKIITTLALLLSAFTVVLADTITVPITPVENDDTPPVNDPNRHKMPPVPVFCTIDIEEGTVTLTSPRLDDIDSYEVWSADGEICLALSSTAEEFTASLSTLTPGDYTIRLICSGYYYTGLITL